MFFFSLLTHIFGGGKYCKEYTALACEQSPVLSIQSTDEIVRSCPFAKFSLHPHHRAISTTVTNTMGSILPPPGNLPSFQLVTGGVVPRNEYGFPGEVYDFQVDSQKWVNDIATANQRTVRGILGYRNGVWYRRCFCCEQGPSRCPQAVCVRMFHSYRLTEDQVHKFLSEYTAVFYCVQLVKIFRGHPDFSSLNSN